MLHNAAKFTDPGGSVTVRLEREGDRVRLSVRDTGIGIEHEMLARVFETFSQADRSLVRSRGGLGLGLLIVKALVESHAGTVACTSAGLGRGAVFTIRLSLEPEPPALTARPRRGKSAPPTFKILLIEDNQDAADSLKLFLEHLGQQVRIASTGPEGLAAAVACHGAGQLPRAEQIYRQVLALDPRNADVLHLLGVIATQSGKHDEAAECILQAIRLNPNDAAYFGNLGLVYQELHRLDEAASVDDDDLGLGIA